MTADADARLAYECAIGRRCSDKHWYSIKRLLAQQNLELTVSNVQFYAELRKSLPRSGLGVYGLLECYQKADQLLNKSAKPIKGAEVLAMLAQYQVIPHQATVSRWFRGLGGYRKDREYSPQQLKSIFTAAFIYKAQTTTKLPEAN